MLALFLFLHAQVLGSESLKTVVAKATYGWT
jgi:hypothetical protein